MASLYRQLRARTTLSLFNDVQLRTRRALLLYTKPMAIAPFWFSTEHPSTALTPFWFPADDMRWIQLYQIVLFLEKKMFLVNVFKMIDSDGLRHAITCHKRRLTPHIIKPSA